MPPFLPALSRRQFIAGTAALAGASAFGAMLPTALRAANGRFDLSARERAMRLPTLAGDSPCWTYGDGWPTELRATRGETMTAVLRNGLKEHTTIHWHGVRVPYAMDGVPFFTQDPVKPGETFDYSFAPPDPGTFFFHPHCDTAQAMSRGLAGVLVVEDPRDKDLFDVDQVVALKDWHVKPDGSFDIFTDFADAARSGTFGNLRTVNGKAQPTIEVPPGARVRLRIVNLDVTRMPMLGFRGAAGMVIATDGNACEPFAAQQWRLGPAMRADVAIQAPNDANAEVILEDIWTNPPTLLARIVTKGKPVTARRGAMRLPNAELPVPNLKQAERLEFSLQTGLEDPKLQEWLKETGGSLDDICKNQRILWAINRKSWPGMIHDVKVPPLAELTPGKSYVFQIFNGSRYIHPMHLHGHTFRVLSASKRKLPPHWADTVLVQPSERVDIAFVAGEPGDWMFHCHIIDHQETGMMGYVRVA